MSTETYSLSVYFSNGLNNSQLRDEINNNITITKTCTDVRTNDDIVSIDFDGVLTSGEKAALNSVIAAHVPEEPEVVVSADTYFINNISSKTCAYSLSNRSTSTGEQHLTGSYTHVSNSGYLSGFSNGKFTVPMDGIYHINMYVNNDGVSLNASYRLMFKDASGNIINSKHALCPTLYNNWTDHLSSTRLFAEGEEVNLYAHLPTSLSQIDVTVRISQLVVGSI